jgi:cell wall-associated NlpC family hydrolase
LIQRVFRLHGIVLPRDSDLQAEVGSLREGGLGAQQAGDLMFFGASGRPITHVGLVIPGGLFVHAYGQVRVGSLEPVHPSYEANLHKIWRFSRDPLGDEAQGS